MTAKLMTQRSAVHNCPWHEIVPSGDPMACNIPAHDHQQTAIQNNKAELTELALYAVKQGAISHSDVTDLINSNPFSQGELIAATHILTSVAKQIGNRFKFHARQAALKLPNYTNTQTQLAILYETAPTIDAFNHPMHQFSDEMNFGLYPYEVMIGLTINVMSLNHRLRKAVIELCERVAPYAFYSCSRDVIGIYQCGECDELVKQMKQAYSTSELREILDLYDKDEEACFDRLANNSKLQTPLNRDEFDYEFYNARADLELFIEIPEIEPTHIDLNDADTSIKDLRAHIQDDCTVLRPHEQNIATVLVDLLDFIELNLTMPSDEFFSLLESTGEVPFDWSQVIQFGSNAEEAELQQVYQQHMEVDFEVARISFDVSDPKRLDNAIAQHAAAMAVMATLSYHLTPELHE